MQKLSFLRSMYQIIVASLAAFFPYKSMRLASFIVATDIL